MLARSRSPFLASHPLAFVFAPAANPEQHDSALIEAFRNAYVTCLTVRRYSVDGLWPRARITRSPFTVTEGMVGHD